MNLFELLDRQGQLAELLTASVPIYGTRASLFSNHQEKH